MITNYFLEEDTINIESNNSFLGTDKFNYKGKINLDPFDFNIESKIQKLDIKNIFPDQNILNEIFSKEFLFNENFNGRFEIKSDNLSNGSFFNEILINSNFVGEKIELTNSNLTNKKIGSLNLDYGNIYLEENDIFLKENSASKFLTKIDFIENF